MQVQLRCRQWSSYLYASWGTIRPLLGRKGYPRLHGRRSSPAKLGLRTIKPDNPRGSAMLDDEAGWIIWADVHDHSPPKKEIPLLQISIGQFVAYGIIAG